MAPDEVTLAQLMAENRQLRETVRFLSAPTEARPQEPPHHERRDMGCRDDEEFYRLLVDCSLQGLLVLQEGQIVFANRTAAEITGIPVETLLTIRLEEFLAFIHPEDRAMVRQRHVDRLQGLAVPPHYEFRAIDKEGHLRWVEIHAGTVECRGRPAVQIALTDITAYKQTEQTLHETESRLHDIAATIPGAVFQFQVRADDSWEILFMNESAADLFEKPAHELTDMNCLLRCLPRGDRETLYHSIKESRRTMLPWACEFQIVTGSGRLKWLQGASQPRSNPDGSVLWNGVLLDITERKRAEEALIAGERKYRQLVETLQEGIWTLDPNDRTTFVNQHMARMLGYTPEEMLGRSVFEFVDEPAAASAARLLERGRQGRQERQEFQFLRKDGRHIHASVKAAPITDETGTYLGVIAATTDITEQRQTAEALRVSEEWSRRIFNEGPIGMVLTSQDGGFFQANPAFCRMLGYGPEEMNGLTFLDVTHPEHREADRRNVQQLWAGQIPCYHTDKRYLAKDGRSVWARLSTSLIRSRGGRPLCALAFIENITERKRAQEQARQREAELLHVTRVSTLGELASGIAHELNQPLSAIANYGDACLCQLRSETPDVARLTRNLGQIVSQSERAGAILRKLRAFIKRTPPQFTAVDLNDVVRGVLTLVQSEIAAKAVQVQLELTEPLPRVCADTIQMEQVLLNLTRNALEAMSGVPEQRRVLTIRTQAVEGGHVRTEVCDTGTGLPAQEPQRIFEPFFTTKAEGLGLGLPISRSIVQRHQGLLTATSNGERGSTFVITLPAR